MLTAVWISKTNSLFVPLGFLYLERLLLQCLAASSLADRKLVATNCELNWVSSGFYLFDVNLQYLSKAHVHDATFRRLRTSAATGNSPHLASPELPLTFLSSKHVFAAGFTSSAIQQRSV